jgi:hypothetical protein
VGTRRFLLTSLLAGTLAAAIAAPGALLTPAQAAPGASAPAAAAARGLAAVGAPQRLGLAAVHLLAGTVRGVSGRGLRGVCVTAAGPSGPSFAMTSADGQYQLSVARAGQYTVEYRDCRSPGRFLPVRTAQIATGALTTLQPVVVRSATASQTLHATLATAGVVVLRPRRSIRVRKLNVPMRGQSTGAMSGRVTDPSGKPLAGICASIVARTWSEGVTTSKKGTYLIRFGSIPPGVYRAEFTSNCAGFLPTGPWAPEWYRGKFASWTANKVRIKAGKITSGINAVMRPAGQITGTVTGASHRRLKGICVVATTPKGNEVSQALTASNGSYRIPGLDPGGYRVLFVPCPGAASDYAAAWWPNAATASKARPVLVRLGHVTSGINAKLTQLGSISGEVRLVNKSGKPIGGMCVWAYSPTNVFENLPLTSSQRNGSYLLQGIPPGTYGVGVNPGCTNNGNYTTVRYPPRIKVSDGKTVAGINVYLQLGGIVSGTVTDAATGKPLAGICVGDGNFGGALTRANGRFRMDQIPAGIVIVGFLGGCGNKGSFAPQWFPGVSNQGAAVSLDIVAGKTVANVNAAMLPGATIAGLVTNAAGRKLTGVCVSVRRPGYISLPYSDLGGNAITVNGIYSLANLAAGKYGVVFYSGCQFYPNVASPQWFKSEPSANTADLISVPAGALVSGIDAVVRPGGSITGVVTAHGQPVLFACVTAVNVRTGLVGDAHDFTSAGGYGIAGLAPGTYSVEAYGCGDDLDAARYHGLVTVRPGHTTGHISFVLSSGGGIAGRILVAGTGAPARGVCVSAYGGLASGFAVTNGRGFYRISGLNTGDYRLSVQTSAPYCGSASANLAPRNLPGKVRVIAGRVTTGVNGVVGRAGSMSGLITETGGAPVPGACVEAVPVSGGVYSTYYIQNLTGRLGKFLLTGLAPGRYHVRVGSASCSDGPVNLDTIWYGEASGKPKGTVVTVRAGQVQSGLDAVLRPDGTVTGTVTGPANALVTGICVSAVPVSVYQSTEYAVTSNGSYRLGDLAPGRYRVEFQSGCGLTGLATQWWQGAASSASAMVITVAPGGLVTGIDATMKA